jgi:hypothetical protein
MPKIKDLGINVIPETMRAPECLPWTVGPVCLPGGFTRDAGCFPTSCGVSPAANFGCTCNTNIQHTNAAVAMDPGCTCQTNIQYTNAAVAMNPGCTCNTNIQHTNAAVAFQSTATCIPNSCGVACGCTHITNPCLGCTMLHTVVNCVTHTTITICYTGSHCAANSTITVCNTGSICPGGSICTTGSVGTITITPTTPQIQGGGLTRESIAQLKDQLQQQIAQLDEHAKTLGPKTADEIDAREKQLKAELDDLATRRSDLKKK